MSKHAYVHEYVVAVCCKYVAKAYASYFNILT